MFFALPLMVVSSTSSTQSSASRCVSICEIRTTVVALSAQTFASSAKYILTALSTCDCALDHAQPVAKVILVVIAMSAYLAPVTVTVCPIGARPKPSPWFCSGSMAVCTLLISSVLGAV